MKPDISGTALPRVVGPVDPIENCINPLQEVLPTNKIPPCF